MTNTLLKKHWLLMLALGIAISLTTISCGSEDEALEDGAPAEEMVMDQEADSVVNMYDEEPTEPRMSDDQPPADPPYQTNVGDKGTITLLGQTPEWTKINLERYQVTFTAPSGTVVNNQVPKGDTVNVIGVQAIGSNPPFGGGLPAPGITDQPVVVHGVQAE